ncbi:hypothetical protein [Vulcanisaeta souniana]|uniref:hypothetical protein n=1 Tax=Vulcanisaeta souniana TaxID=164452 RepID=UPI001663DECF|nr:hypothetical protein [Vulcanisaeta souniana]
MTTRYDKPCSWIDFCLWGFVVCGFAGYVVYLSGGGLPRWGLGQGGNGPEALANDPPPDG